MATSRNWRNLPQVIPQIRDSYSPPTLLTIAPARTAATCMVHVIAVALSLVSLQGMR